MARYGKIGGKSDIEVSPIDVKRAKAIFVFVEKLGTVELSVDMIRVLCSVIIHNDVTIGRLALHANMDLDKLKKLVGQMVIEEYLSRRTEEFSDDVFISYTAKGLMASRHLTG